MQDVTDIYSGFAAVYDELMKNGGKYSDMFQIQAQYYKSEKEGVTC